MLTPSPERSSEGDETEQKQTPHHQVNSFRWVQFEENIKRSYQQLREKNRFNDVTISCENSEVEAHKVVLATSSDFFSRLLERSSFRNNPHPIIFINDVKMKHLMFILEFMYTGEVNVPQNDTTSVLEAAVKLEIKGLQDDYFNDLNPLDTGIRKRQAELSSSSSLSLPEKRSRSDSWSPIPSTSRGSSPIRLQPKINLVGSSFVENDRQENAEDDSRENDKEDGQEKAEDDTQENDKEDGQENAEDDTQENDKEDRQENAEDDTQENDKEDGQENAEGEKLKKDQEDKQDNAKDDELENINQSVVEPISLSNAVILTKTPSTSPSSDEKMNRESERAALVEKVESGMFKCKKCEYTSKAAFNVKKHAEGHLSPREYKCNLCPSVVKKEVYLKHHMKTKHSITLKTVCWIKK